MDYKILFPVIDNDEGWLYENTLSIKEITDRTNCLNCSINKDPKKGWNKFNRYLNLYYKHILRQYDYYVEGKYRIYDGDEVLDDTDILQRLKSLGSF
jgi:hypothetical protein